MHSEWQETALYPRHVSDRADELIAELDSAQCAQLYAALQTQTLAQWWYWLGQTREAIGKYDRLTRAERKRQTGAGKPRAQSKSAPPVTDALRWHHACIYLELWRSRMQQHYFHLPPAGPPLLEHAGHRGLLLGVLAAFDDADERDLWPFALQPGQSAFPFRE